MKKLIFLIPKMLLLLACFAFSNETKAQAQFSTVISDVVNKTFTKVKTFDKDTYASGTRDGKATFTKFDATGALNWTVQLDFQSIATDFEIITDEPGAPAAAYFLIGRTEPLDTNNRSFIAQISETGALNWVHTYNQTGRESFNRIVRRYNPPSLPRYYVAGVKNQNNTQGTLDDGTMWVFNGEGVLLNRWQYTDNDAIDSELGTSVINWATGQLLGIGNRVASAVFPNPPIRYGMIYTINDNTGAIINNVKLPNNYFVLDAYRVALSGNQADLIISGVQIGTNNSFIARLNGATFATKWWQQISNQRSLYDIGSDGNGRVYATGQTAQNDFNIITIQDNNTSATVLSSRKITETGASNFQQGHLWVRPNENNTLVYTDSRIRTGGFNVQDIVIARQGLGFENFDCLTTENPTSQSLNLAVTPQAVTFTSLSKLDSAVQKGANIKLNSQKFCPKAVACTCDSLKLQVTSNENCFKKYCIKKTCLAPLVTVAYSNVTGGTINSFVLDANSGCTGQTAGNTILFNPACNSACIPITISGMSNVSSNYVAYTLTFTFEDGTTCQKRDSFGCIVRCPVFSVNGTADCSISIHVQPLSNVPITNVAYVLTGGAITGNMAITGSCTAPLTNGVNGNANLSANCTAPFDIALSSTGNGLTFYTLTLTLANGQTCTYSGQYKCNIPPPCFDVLHVKATCGTNGNYTINGIISNPGAATSIVAATPSGVIIGPATISLPAGNNAIPFTFQYIPSSTTNSVCFNFFTVPGTPSVCNDQFCVPLPVCECMKVTKPTLDCIGKNSLGQNLYHFAIGVTNLTGNTSNINISSPQGTVTSVTPTSIPNNAGANVNGYFTLTNTTATSACFNITLGKEPFLCDTVVCIKIPACDTCVNTCKNKWTLKTPSVAINSNSQFTLSTALSSSLEVKEIRATVISATITQTCLSGPPSVLTPAVIFVNATLPPLVSGIGTQELTWTDLSCQPFNAMPIDFKFNTSVAAKKGCSQKIKLCLRITLTTCDCVSCEKEVCVEFIRLYKPPVIVETGTGASLIEEEAKVAKKPTNNIATNRLTLTPNPAEDYTIIALDINEGGSDVSMDVINEQGVLVEQIYQKKQLDAGKHQLTLDTYDYPNGVYFIRYNANGVLKTERLIVIKK